MSASRHRLYTSQNPAIVTASTNPGGHYGRRQTYSGTDDRRDKQCGWSNRGSCQDGRQEGQEGRQESGQESDAEESQEGQEGRQEIREEIRGKEICKKGRQKGRQESGQEEKEGQEVEALSVSASRARASGSTPEAFVLRLEPDHGRRLTTNTAAAQAIMPEIATGSSRSSNSA